MLPCIGAGALPNSLSPMSAEGEAVIGPICSDELSICWSILLTSRDLAGPPTALGCCKRGWFSSRHLKPPRHAGGFIFVVVGHYCKYLSICRRHLFDEATERLLGGVGKIGVQPATL